MKRALACLAVALIAGTCVAFFERPIVPIEGPCFFSPLHNAACQQAT